MYQLLLVLLLLLLNSAHTYISNSGEGVSYSVYGLNFGVYCEHYSNEQQYVVNYTESSTYRRAFLSSPNHLGCFIVITIIIIIIILFVIVAIPLLSYLLRIESKRKQEITKK